MVTESRLTVPEATSALLSQLSREWSPSRFFEREISELHWGPIDFTHAAKTVRLHGHSLALSCQTSRQDPLVAQYPFAQLHGQPISAKTRDGYQIQAFSVVATGRSQSIGGSEGAPSKLALSAFNWSMWKVGVPAHVWVGEVKGEHGDHFGNLNLSGEWGGSWGHYRLEGSKYTYYLINIGSRKERTLLVVDCNGEPFPLPALFHDELQLMGVAFGSPIAVAELVGISLDREVCGWVSGYFADQDRGRWLGAPVPMHEHKHCWVVPFFKKLCMYRAERPLSETKRFILSIWYLLAAYRETAIDIRRAHLFLALTCMARHTCGIECVAAPEQWESWVGQRQDEITAMALGTSSYFVEQVRRQWIPSNLSYIRSALDREHLPVIPEIEVELASASDGLAGVIVDMVGNARSGLAVLRSLLSALISREIGYRGAIEGWLPDQDFGWARPDQKWWPVASEDEPEAFVVYDAHSSHDLPAVRNLWPTFTALTIPDSAPLSTVRSFAFGLAQRTNGKVLARLHPVPRETPNDRQLYDLLLYATTSRTRAVLFTVYENDDAKLVVTDWDGELDVVLDNTWEIEIFLNKVANSKHTEVRIQRILLEDELFSEH